MNDEDLIKKIEDAYWRMSRAPEGRAWRPPANELNPGSFKPQDQVVHALPTVDQTKVVTRSPGGTVDSDGRMQTLNMHHDDGVRAVSGAPMIPRNFDGQAQILDLLPINQGVTASAGTSPAYDVNVSSQNLHVDSRVALPPLPNITQVNPSGKAPGTGVPTNVHVR